MNKVELDAVQTLVNEIVAMDQAGDDEDALDERCGALAELVQAHVFKKSGDTASAMDADAVDNLRGVNYRAEVDGDHVNLLIDTDEDNQIEIQIPDLSSIG